VKGKSRTEITLGLISTIATVIGLLAAIIAIIFSATSLQSISVGPIELDIPTATPSPVTPIPQSIPAQVAVLQDEVAVMRQELDALTQMMASNPNPDAVTLRTDLDSLDERLSLIEEAILDNPARALQFTLLSREMEDLQETYESDLESTRQEIERIYDFNKWFIGLMFTMAIGLLGLAVSNFIKKPEKAAPIEQQEPEEKQQSPAANQER